MTTKRKGSPRPGPAQRGAGRGAAAGQASNGHHLDGPPTEASESAQPSAATAPAWTVPDVPGSEGSAHATASGSAPGARGDGGGEPPVDGTDPGEPGPGHEGGAGPGASGPGHAAGGGIGPGASGPGHAAGGGIGPGEPGSGYPGVGEPAQGYAVPDGLVVAHGGLSAGRAPRQLSPEMRKTLDIAITVGGLLVVMLLAFALAVVEAFFAPLRLNGSGVRIPVSLVLALVTNPLLGWFAYTTTGRRLSALLPAAVWCVVWILAAGRTTEGDLLITDGNWVGLLTLFAGPLAFAVGIYVSAIRQRPGNSKAAPLAPRSVDG